MMPTPIKLKRQRAEPGEEEQEYCQVMFKNGSCGGKLDGDLFCDRGGGYPWHVDRQPTVCPQCRHRLHWNGNCVHERGGCWNGFEHEIEGPGDCYEEQDGHWVNTGQKQGMSTKAEAAKKMGELADILGANMR